MKVLPETKWKRILVISILVLAVVGASVLTYTFHMINRDAVTKLNVMNSNGTPTALIIYHPGLTSFTKDVSYAFADGLVTDNWRVEVTTASSQAPTEVSEYKLLVFLSPVYGGEPAPSIKRHIERIGNLQGMETVLLATAAGSPGSTMDSMSKTIQDHNGTVKHTLTLFNLAPNEGDKTAIEIAEQVGKEITP